MIIQLDQQHGQRANITAVVTGTTDGDERLAALVREWLEILPNWNRLNDSYNAAAEAGLIELGRGSDAGLIDERRLERAAENSGWAAVGRAREQVDHRFCQIEEAIIKGKNRPKSVAGLGAIAAISAFSNPELWAGPARDLDWNELCLRVLIESALDAAGIPLASIVGEAA